jgi:alpha-ribazole phosphatase
MRIYLVRHPQPAVATGICYGSTNLYVTAQEQRKVLYNLAALLPDNVPLYSSPLLRCAHLAEKLHAQHRCISMTLDARLMEMDFGAWEMCAWDVIPRSEIDAWNNDLLHYCPGGGESVLRMAQRVQAFHDELLQSNHDNVIVVCHAGTIRMLLACQRGLPLAEMARYAAQTRHKVEYGELLILDC